MIELKVADYCHSCPEFEAYVEIDECGYVIRMGRVLRTTVECKHAKRCQSIFEYFKQTYDIASKPVRIKETE